MKILVTGSEGQIGRALLASVPGETEVIACPHRDLEISDERAVRKCIDRHAPDVVINAAAYTAVDRAESEPELARCVNSDGPRHLAHAACDAGSRLIHISTDFVFDGASSVPYPPEAATHPLNVYGATKRAGEEAVLGVLPERSVIVRTAWVHAARGANFVTTMLRLMATRGSVSVVADQVGTPTSAGSIAAAIWRIVALPGLGGICHWTDAGVASWYDFAVAISEEGADLGLLSSGVVVRPISTADYPTKARRPSYSVLDKKSSQDALALQPVHWRVNLRAVLRAVRNE